MGFSLVMEYDTQTHYRMWSMDASCSGLHSCEISTRLRTSDQGVGLHWHREAVMQTGVSCWPTRSRHRTTFGKIQYRLILPRCGALRRYHGLQHRSTTLTATSTFQVHRDDHRNHLNSLKQQKFIIQVLLDLRSFLIFGRWRLHQQYLATTR